MIEKGKCNVKKYRNEEICNLGLKPGIEPKLKLQSMLNCTRGKMTLSVRGKVVEIGKDRGKTKNQKKPNGGSSGSQGRQPRIVEIFPPKLTESE